MTFKTPRELMEDYCNAAADIRQRFGVESALRYLVGEKLSGFARTGEGDQEFLDVLPAFSAKVRELFTAAEIQDHFDEADADSLVESDIMQDASADELEEIRESLEDDRLERQHRSWIRAMLLRVGA